MMTTISHAISRLEGGRGGVYLTPTLLFGGGKFTFSTLSSMKDDKVPKKGPGM